MVRTDPTAEASLAAILDRSKFGIAMAAMIRMMATTISNSINEKPFSLRMSYFPFYCNYTYYTFVKEFGCGARLNSTAVFKTS
jgi:hypothetical protein